MWKFIKIFAKNGPKLIKWFMAKPFSDKVMLIKDFVIPKIKLPKGKSLAQKKDYSQDIQSLSLVLLNRRNSEKQQISSAVEGSLSRKMAIAKKAVEREVDKINQSDNKVDKVIPKSKLFSTGNYSKPLKDKVQKNKIGSDINVDQGIPKKIEREIKGVTSPTDITSRKYAPKELKQAFEAIENKINTQGQALSKQNVVVGSELAKTILGTAKEVNKAKNDSLNRLEENIDKRYLSTTKQIEATHNLINDQNKIISTQIVETTNIQAKNIKNTGNKINKTNAESLNALSSQLYKNELARVESHKESLKMMQASKSSMEDLLLKMDDSKNIKAILGNTYNIMKAQYAGLQDTKRNADQLIHDITNDVARQIGETVGFFGGALAQGLGLVGDALKDIPFIGPIGDGMTSISKGILGLLGLEPGQINGLLNVFTKLKSHQQANKEARAQYGLSTKSATKLMAKDKNGKSNFENQKDKINKISELVKDMKNDISMINRDKKTSSRDKREQINRTKQSYNEKIKKISSEIAKDIGITEDEDIFNEGLISEIEDTGNVGEKKISTEQLEKNLQLTSQALQYREGNNAEVLKNINSVVQGNDEGEKKFLYKKYAQILAEKDSSYWDKNGDIDYDRMVNDNEFKRKLFGAAGLLLRPKTAETHAEETISNRVAPYNSDTIKMLGEYKQKEQELTNEYYPDIAQAGMRGLGSRAEYQRRLNKLQKTYAPFLKSRDRRQEEQEKAQIIPMLQKTFLPELFNKKNKLEMNKNYNVNNSDLLKTNIEIQKQKRENKDIINLIKKYYPDVDAFIKENINNNNIKIQTLKNKQEEVGISKKDNIMSGFMDMIRRSNKDIINLINFIKTLKNKQEEVKGYNNLGISKKDNIMSGFMDGIRGVNKEPLNYSAGSNEPPAISSLFPSSNLYNKERNVSEIINSLGNSIDIKGKDNKQNEILEAIAKISEENTYKSNVMLQDIINTQLETLKDIKEMKNNSNSPIILQADNVVKSPMFDIKNENSL